MRVFQYKHQEIFISEQFNNEERFIEQYRNISEELLRIKNISHDKIYQSIKLQNHKITSNPLIIESLLRKKELPSFQFLACKN
jgi:hypothetical protein